MPKTELTEPIKDIWLEIQQLGQQLQEIRALLEAMVAEREAKKKLGGKK
jgi:hypothetical protein